MNVSQPARSLFNRLRYKHLLMLVTLGNSLNLHRAAETLNMSQPATSRMLQEIEDAFGCSLFERQARGMRPTVLGEELLRFARAALNGLERCAEELADRQAGGYGYLAVGAIMGAVPDLVVQSIAEIKSNHPLLRLRIMGDTSDQLSELLDQRRIDVAVARLTNSDDRNRFAFEPLGDEHLVVVVRAGHPLNNASRPSLIEMVEAWPWILQPDTSPARVALEQAFSRLEVPSPCDVIECSSVFAMLQLVQITDGILVLTDTVVRDYVQTGLLRILDVEVEEKLSPFGLILRKDEQPSRELAMFLKILRKWAVK
ncbi:LysR family transcriptional regulator [Pseudomonas sp. S32]|uniref:LysR family transcriptional regulator n=1 Tax=Pseudomonas sp. S32 TaxID=2767448 RepID=UPI001911E296|nr:LysR family transcriptional regulator [Pseudomonas sp. S32]